MNRVAYFVEPQCGTRGSCDQYTFQGTNHSDRLADGCSIRATRSLGYNVPCLSKPILLDELRTNVQTALARGETLSGA
jgi:hypothetical protein